MSIRAIHDRVIVKRDEQEELENGIFIGNQGDEPTVGTVISVGPGKADINGVIIPSVVAVGDRVIVAGGEEITIDDETFTVVFEKDIVGILS
jgi:co-chaperonin GroES (HSP10)